MGLMYDAPGFACQLFFFITKRSVERLSPIPYSEQNIYLILSTKKLHIVDIEISHFEL